MSEVFVKLLSEHALFFMGAAKLIDVWEDVFFEKIVSESAHDYFVIESDWKEIGADIQHAIETFKATITEESNG